MNNYQLASVVDIGTAASLYPGLEDMADRNIDSDGYLNFQEMVVLDLNETDG